MRVVPDWHSPPTKGSVVSVGGGGGVNVGLGGGVKVGLGRGVSVGLGSGVLVGGVVVPQAIVKITSIATGANLRPFLFIGFSFV
jgi:hypothetical protein